MHPIKLGVSYSIPRISWGKFFHENNQVKLPVSVQANHCLVDGIQAAKFYEQLQNILDTPEKFFL
jgi:chloramphenicol O-acetyltransferase type A